MRKLGFAVIIQAVALMTAATFVVGCNTNQTLSRQADDAAISTAVKAKLAGDARFSTLTSVEVNSTNGVVTLAGTARSGAEREQIEALAKAVPGVVRVNNNIQVVSP